MKRYAETFFRYWLLVLIPIVVLPIGEFAMIRHTPKGVLASANIWVDQAPGGAGASYSQWETPAQIEMDTFNQLLQTSSFDLGVAQSSPAYRQALATTHSGAAAVVTDLTTNVKLTTYGSSLLNISYTSKNWLIAQQVVQGLLNTVNEQVRQLSQQQSRLGVSYYTYQVRQAQQSEQQSARRLSNYMSAKGYTALDLQNDQSLDPTLAGLLQQNQLDQTAVNSAQQALAKAQAQANLPASLVGSSNFHVADPPSLAVVSSKKKDIMNLAIALVVGLLLGGGFVVVRTAQDRSIRYADEVQPLLDLPVLAVVPFSSTFGEQAKSTRRVPGKLLPRERSASA